MADGSLCLGPDEWLVVGHAGETALGGLRPSAAPTSRSRPSTCLRFRTSRPRRAHQVLLARPAPAGLVDPGLAVQTMIAHAAVVLIAVDARGDPWLTDWAAEPWDVRPS